MKFPTGGTVRECICIESVKLRYRQYSLEERRVGESVSAAVRLKKFRRFFASFRLEAPMKGMLQMATAKGNTQKITVMAMLVALSVVLVYFVHFPIFPAAPFLEYDPADIPILIGAFALGPVTGLILTVVACAIQAATVSVQSGVYGFLMHVIATSALVVVASVIYRVRHTRAGAVLGLVCGTAAMGAVMLVANHFITPYFMGVPTATVDAMLLPVILPFNLIKAGVNSVITFLVYKPISRVVFGEKHEATKNQTKAQE